MAVMQIEVTKLLEAAEGERLSFELKDEPLELDDLSLKSPAKGELTFMRVSDGVVLDGWTEAEIASECHRCLRDFTRSVRTALRGRFSLQPTEDTWPLRSERGKVYADLKPLMREEFILQLPLQAVCRENCLGVCVVCGQVQEAVHSHA